ncbi:hypothetical protein HAZT_HAZT004137 [Hyalella azteca]|uniref:Low molecular weight phosphotyrosine protein phosphatase n=1 Tax=Hyalella azteca TaxID=294128 RepID=A0A6A0H5Q3_HYAAZ|nr:hypothetical protein HAZT_HAZT004137 [Hyalella azteca]
MIRTAMTPDSRAQQTMKKHDVPMDHRARQIKKEDFTKFDFIFGKDEENMDDLKRMKPANSTATVELFGKYHTKKNLIIRDPYYDEGSEGFEECYQQCVVCSRGFIAHLKSLK